MLRRRNIAGGCRRVAEFQLPGAAARAARRPRAPARAAVTSRSSSRRLVVFAFSTQAAAVAGPATRAICRALVQPSSPPATASRRAGRRSNSSARRLNCQVRFRLNPSACPAYSSSEA